jgi:hypothetical protein
MPDLNSSSPEHNYKSLRRCVDAAQACIRIGEEVKKVSFTVDILDCC